MPNHLWLHEKNAAYKNADAIFVCILRRDEKKKPWVLYEPKPIFSVGCVFSFITVVKNKNAPPFSFQARARFQTSFSLVLVNGCGEGQVLKRELTLNWDQFNVKKVILHSEPKKGNE